MCVCVYVCDKGGRESYIYKKKTKKKYLLALHSSPKKETFGLRSFLSLFSLLLQFFSSTFSLFFYLLGSLSSLISRSLPTWRISSAVSAPGKSCLLAKMSSDAPARRCGIRGDMQGGRKVVSERKKKEIKEEQRCLSFIHLSLSISPVTLPPRQGGLPARPGNLASASDQRCPPPWEDKRGRGGQREKERKRKGEIEIERECVCRD